MRFLVTGRGGMLANAVIKLLEEMQHEVVAPTHKEYNIAIADTKCELAVGVDRVINCAGSIPLKNKSNVLMMADNSIGPWRLAENYGDVHVVQVSTDCVFSGMGTRPYRVGDLPDPDSLYGRSKLMGEVRADNVTVVRTSFIGIDHGLMRWAINSSGSVQAAIEGWTNHWWSGAHVREVAGGLIHIAERKSPTRAIEHLSMAEPISKANLLQRINIELDLNLNIQMIRHEPGVMRGLEPTLELSVPDTWMGYVLDEYKASGLMSHFDGSAMV